VNSEGVEKRALFQYKGNDPKNPRERRSADEVGTIQLKSSINWYASLVSERPKSYDCQTKP